MLENLRPSLGRTVIPAMGCRGARPQASVRLALISLKLSTSFSEILILESVFSSSYIPMSFSDKRGM